MQIRYLYRDSAASFSVNNISYDETGTHRKNFSVHSWLLLPKKTQDKHQGRACLVLTSGYKILYTEAALLYNQASRSIFFPFIRFKNFWSPRTGSPGRRFLSEVVS
jgi:cephalosporin-C deacetylase-like acetyl esterase